MQAPSTTFQLSNRQVRAFRDDGYILTPPLFDATTLSAMKDAIQDRYRSAVEAAEKASARDADLVRTQAFLVQNHQHGEIFNTFCRAPALVEIARKLIGPDVDVYWSQAIVKPGLTGRKLPWHQDARYAITEPLDGGFTALVAITESKVENGGVFVLPGGHRDGLLAHEYDADQERWVGTYPTEGEVAADMEPGQAMIFSRLLPHYSGPNTTSDTRISYQLGFTPPGLTRDSKPFGDQLPLLRADQLV